MKQIIIKDETGIKGFYVNCYTSVFESTEEKILSYEEEIIFLRKKNLEYKEELKTAKTTKKHNLKFFIRQNESRIRFLEHELNYLKEKY